MESEYLQKEVGDVLSRALSETVVAMPVDPIEFLANWLVQNSKREKALKQLHQKALELAQEKQRIEAEANALREKELQAARAKEEAIIAAEQARLAALSARIKPFEESLITSDTASGALNDQERKLSPLSLWSGRLSVFKKEAESQQMKDELQSLNKGKSPPGQTTLVLSLSFYLFDLVDDPIEPWKVLRPILKEENICEKIVSFDPLSLQRTSKFRRVERRLLALDVGGLKKTSFIAYFVFSWLKLCVETRKAANAYKIQKLKLAEEQPVIKPLAPGEHSPEDDEDEEGDEEEDLQQVISKILRTEQEAEEMEQEAAKKKQQDEETGAAATEEEEEEDQEEEQKK